VDANHDGKAEVYVSNLRGQRLASYVLEWRGDRLKKLATEIQWYFNRLTVPGKETILLGQKKNMEDIFVPGVYHLQFAGGSYQPLEGISLPRRANVFNFTQGDLDGDWRPLSSSREKSAFTWLMTTAAGCGKAGSIMGPLPIFSRE